MNRQAKLTAGMAERMWKPGESGNPNGRPREITNALDRALTRTQVDAIAKAVIRTAKKGSVKAFDSIADRIEGKVPQAVTGDEGGPVQLQIAVVHMGAVTMTKGEG